MEGLKDCAYSEVGEFVRMFLWNLHTTINEANEKPVFPKERLIEYQTKKIADTWFAVEPVLRSAMQYRKVSFLTWVQWKGITKMLQGMYGVQ